MVTKEKLMDIIKKSKEVEGIEEGNIWRYDCDLIFRLNDPRYGSLLLFSDSKQFKDPSTVAVKADCGIIAEFTGNEALDILKVVSNEIKIREETYLVKSKAILKAKLEAF